MQGASHNIGHIVMKHIPKNWKQYFKNKSIHVFVDLASFGMVWLIFCLKLYTFFIRTPFIRTASLKLGQKIRTFQMLIMVRKLRCSYFLYMRLI